MVIVMLDITRNMTNFQTFAAEHNISLVCINIQMLINEMGQRIRFLLCDTINTDKVKTLLDSLLIENFRRKLMAIITYLHFC